MALKQKSKETLDLIASDPKISATEAYSRTHATSNRTTARTNAYKLMRKPEAKIYLQKHIDRARRRVVELVDKGKDENIQLKASQDILDRSYGKPSQSVSPPNLHLHKHIHEKSAEYDI